MSFELFNWIPVRSRSSPLLFLQSPVSLRPLLFLRRSVFVLLAELKELRTKNANGSFVVKTTDVRVRRVCEVARMWLVVVRPTSSEILDGFVGNGEDNVDAGEFEIAESTVLSLFQSVSLFDVVLFEL